MNDPFEEVFELFEIMTIEGVGANTSMSEDAANAKGNTVHLRRVEEFS